MIGKDRWPSATATVFSTEWLCKPLHSDGHRHVTYDYSVDGQRYSGEFFDYCLEADDYLKPGQTFEVKFNPRKPSRSYFPDLRSGPSLLWAAAGGGLAVLMLISRLACGR